MALRSLRGEKEFRKVRSHGVAVRGPLLGARLAEYRPRYGEVWQPRAVVGIVVSKKTLKRAVDRNRARRRVREALRTLPGGLPPCRAILMPNPAVLTAPFADLQAALVKILAQAPRRVRQGKGQRPDKSPQSGNPAASGRVREAVSNESQAATARALPGRADVTPERS